MGDTRRHAEKCAILATNRARVSHDVQSLASASALPGAEAFLYWALLRASDPINTASGMLMQIAQLGLDYGEALRNRLAREGAGTRSLRRIGRRVAQLHSHFQYHRRHRAPSARLIAGQALLFLWRRGSSATP
jgi:hypothetical protein